MSLAAATGMRGLQSTGAGIRPPQNNISGYKTRNVQNYTPEQMQLFSQLLGGAQGGGGLNQGLSRLSSLAGGSDEGFDQLEAPYYSNFQKALGQIGSRFAGAGAVGSSAFQNATSGAAQSLAENLGSQRMGIQQNALDSLLGLSERLLGNKPYDTFMEKKPDWGEMIGKLLGGAAGAFAGGPFGASAGSQFGGQIGSMFGR